MKNDKFIQELLDDPNYRVANGVIHTMITKTGKVSVNNIWRLLAITMKDGKPTVKYKSRTLSLARIIYAKFYFMPDPSKFVVNLDEDQTKVDFVNLTQMTRSEVNFRRFKYHGSVKGNAKLSVRRIHMIRLDAMKGKTYKTISEEHGISKGHISDIVNNKIWKEQIYQIAIG